MFFLKEVPTPLQFQLVLIIGYVSLKTELCNAVW